MGMGMCICLFTVHTNVWCKMHKTNGQIPKTHVHMLQLRYDVMQHLVSSETVAPEAMFFVSFQVKYEKWIDTAVAGGNCSFLEHFFPHARTCNEMNSLFAQRTIYTSALLKWSVFYTLFTHWFHGKHMQKSINTQAIKVKTVAVSLLF